MSNHEIEDDRIRWRIDLAKKAIANSAIHARSVLEHCRDELADAGHFEEFGEVAALLHFIDEYEAITKEKNE